MARLLAPSDGHTWNHPDGTASWTYQIITDLSQCGIMAKESGTGGPVSHSQDVSHAHTSAEGGSTCGTWRGVDTYILKAPTDVPSEGLEQHNGVRTMDIEEESNMTLSSKRARMIATGQTDSSSIQALRRMGGPRWPTGSVLEREAGTSWTKLSLIWMCWPVHLSRRARRVVERKW
jgi:hypothetical protein